MAKTEIVDNENKTSSPSPTVIKLEYSPEIVQELDKLNRSNCSELVKKLAMKRLLGSIKQCCVCQGLPEYEVTYPLDNATKIERYCSDCYNKRGETDSKYIDPNKYFVLATKS